MSLIDSAKDFFGLGVYPEPEEAYYDDRAYAGTRDDAAYDRPQAAPARDGRGYDYEYKSQYNSEYNSQPRGDYADYAPARPHTPAIVTATPRSYNDAREIGEPFRDGDVVIMELTELDSANAKRLVDFAAGLCFALRGTMHNLTRNVDTDRRVFAIAPERAGIAVSELERAAHLR